MKPKVIFSPAILAGFALAYALDALLPHAQGVSTAILGALIPLATAALGAFGGSKGNKQTSTTNWQGQDPRLYEYNPMEREGLRSAQIGMVGDLFANMPGGGAYWGNDPNMAGYYSAMFGGGGGGGIGGVGNASAEYIDPSSWVYQQEAPAPWMSGMLSKGREYLSSATEDALRMGRDQAVRSGMSTSSPAYAYMQALQRRSQQQALANALRDAKLAWTLPAAEREAGRLGQNAKMGTDVNLANMNKNAQIAIARGQLAEAAAARNAAAQQFGASFARQGYGQVFDMLSSMIKPSASMQYLNTGGTQSSGGGLTGALTGGMAGLQAGFKINDMFGGVGGGGGGSLMGNASGWGGVGGPVYSPQANYPQQMATMGMPSIFPDWYGSGYTAG